MSHAARSVPIYVVSAIRWSSVPSRVVPETGRASNRQPGKLASHSLPQLLAGIGDRLPELGRGDPSGASRQLTLGATIDWSYNLLRPEERLLWSRLAVFAGGFEPGPVTQVCGWGRLSAEDVEDLLARLGEKSVVVREPGWDRARFRLLETMRQYGLQRRREVGEEPAARPRHSAWMRGVAAAAARPDGCQPAMFDTVQVEHDRCAAFAAGRLGERGFQAAFDKGAALTKDQAVAYALDQAPPASNAGRPQRGTSPLTRRELQVALRVAEGASNRSIASELVISERTVESHVTNMLNKLGLSSRVQLARWVAGAAGG